MTIDVLSKRVEQLEEDIKNMKSLNRIKEIRLQNLEKLTQDLILRNYEFDTSKKFIIHINPTDSPEEVRFKTEKAIREYIQEEMENKS
jgi:signal recognition particle GTPase